MNVADSTPTMADKEAKKKTSHEKLIAREKAAIERICSDDNYAYYFFHEQCRPLLSRIMWTMFGNNADFDELVNELFLKLKKPNSEGEMWHALKTFDYRTSLFDYIKIIAIRHFYTPSKEVFKISDNVIETELLKEMIAKLNKANYRKFMWFKYIDMLDDDIIANKLSIEKSQITSLSRMSIRQFKKVLEHNYPEYLDLLFYKDCNVEVGIDEVPEKEQGLVQDTNDNKIDVYKYLDYMPNLRYRKVLEFLFLDDMEPEELAVEMNTPISNIYNLKSRAIDQLRDIAIYSNEISNLCQYINLISDDRYRQILNSIFIERQDYDAVCSTMNIPESQLKLLKKKAMKELKNVIFKKKS